MRLAKRLLNTSWFVWALLFSLFVPASLEMLIPAFSYILTLLRTFTCVFVFFVFIADIRIFLKNKYNIFLILQWAVILFSTLSSSEASMQIYIATVVTVTSISFLIEALMMYAPQTGIRCLYCYFALVTIINTLTFLIFPNGLYAYHGSWGITGFLGPDNAAYAYYIVASALAMIYSQYIIKSTTFVNVLVYLNAFFFVFHNDIATGIACQLLWGVLFICYHFKWLRKMLNARIALYVILGGFTFVVLLRNLILEPIVSALGRSITLTGRTIIWDSALSAIRLKPVFGYGAYVGGGVDDILSTQSYGTHNYMLNMVLWGGIVGGILFLLMIFYACRVNKSLRSTKYYKCIAIALVVSALRTLTENSGFQTLYILFAMISCTQEFTIRMQNFIPRRRKWRVKLPWSAYDARYEREA